MASRDMLWAEACILYQARVPWWFSDTKSGVAAAAAAKTEQEARYQADPWEQPIADYLDSRLHRPDFPAYQVDIHLVFQQALQLDKDRWNQPAMNRVARCMKRLGWSRKQVIIDVKTIGRTEKKKVWKYVRPPTADELVMDAREPGRTATSPVRAAFHQ